MISRKVQGKFKEKALEKAEDIVTSEIDLMEEFELGVILSPARRNGAYSMLKTIKEYAKNLIA